MINIAERAKAMFARIVPIVVLASGVICMGVLAALPGQKTAGPGFKADKYTLTLAKLKATSDVNLADETGSKFSVSLDGALETPADVDAVATRKRLSIVSITDDGGGDMTPRANVPASSFNAYNSIQQQIGQVELPKTDIQRDATRIGKMVLETDVVVARKRAEVKLPAVVMEDFKDVGNGVSIRISRLQMSQNRQLIVTLNYKRLDAGTTAPFIEQVFAVDPQGNELGGGRWTEGDPFAKVGLFTASFSLGGTQVHQSFRVVIVTDSEACRLSFEVKDIFKR